MKKLKVITTVFIIIFSVSLVTCFCFGCDFVKYVEKSENQVISDEVKLLQEEYVDRLYTITSEIKYRENEQKLYEYAVQDAVNELYECRSEAELKQVYEKHLLNIGKIKTDEEYTTEEEVAALSAYRVAVLGQAEESYDKKKYTEEQVTYFDSVLAAFSGEIFETVDREKINELLQKFYFDIHKEDEILSLINFADISVYEDSQQKILRDMLDKCIEDIRSFDKQENIDEAKKVYVFEVYKRNTVKKLNEYVDLRLYRNEQVAEIKKILTEHLKLAEETETNVEADNVFREYQIAVYSIPTDEMLYSDELADLKAELNNSLTGTYKLSFYRENEGQTIQKLLTSFQELLKTLKKKEDVLSQYVILKNKLDSVKTAKDLDEEDRLKLIEELYVDLQNRIEKNIDGLDKDDFLLKAEKAYSDMQDRISLDGVRAVHRVLANEISAKFGAALDILREELSDYKDTVYYREKEQNEVNSIKEEFLPKFIDELSIDEAKALLLTAKAAIDEIKTNDDLWNDSVTKFRTDLKSLYGEAILEEPKSLTEANDYYELADIVDYYAFYQLSGTEFVCDTFRVKLNFDHNDAWTELVNVYWYCELIRTAVGITSYFENNSDFIVFQLIPYNFASVSNERPALNRLKSAVEFDSDKSQMTVRSAAFDDFAYYKYERTITVWNSQQLWYALEHEYVPLCVSGSPAELVMNRAKEILREIIMEGMSDEEKIFQIYIWIGNNIQFDSSYKSSFNSSPFFPDEKFSLLNSSHIEGALLDKLSVCYSCAKTNLLLLRLEGIKSFYVFGSTNMQTIDYAIDSGHAYNYVYLNNNWYIQDVERSFGMSPFSGYGLIYGYLLVPAINNYLNFSGRNSKVNSFLWEFIESNAFTDLKIYKKLEVDNINVFLDKEQYLNIMECLYGFEYDSFSVFIVKPDLNYFISLLNKNNNYSYQHMIIDDLVEFYFYYNKLY